MKFRLGELFCGPGGIALGAHRAAQAVPGIDFEHAWASDYDADTCATYLRNVPGATESSVIHQDVRTLDITELSPIDGLAFGFPCNDFSLVGEKKGVDGTFGPLYQYGVRALDAHEPTWFVAENVGGLSSSNEGRAFEAILDALSRASSHGYRVYPHLYKFDQYGVPQRRHRIIIVGIRGDIDVDFRVPDPTPYQDIDVRVGPRLTEPPISPDTANNELTKQSANVIARLEHILPGQNAFNADIPERLRLNVKGATISQIYRRLEFDRPSYTVTGSGGGGTHVYHWAEPRALTNRERARIQTFPDSFEFEGSKESVRKQIGMAVPVDGAKAVFTALFNCFAAIDYPSIPTNIPTRPAIAPQDTELAVAT